MISRRRDASVPKPKKKLSTTNISSFRRKKQKTLNMTLHKLYLVDNYADIYLIYVC